MAAVTVTVMVAVLLLMRPLLALALLVAGWGVDVGGVPGRSIVRSRVMLYSPAGAPPRLFLLPGAPWPHRHDPHGVLSLMRRRAPPYLPQRVPLQVLRSIPVALLQRPPATLLLGLLLVLAPLQPVRRAPPLLRARLHLQRGAALLSHQGPLELWSQLLLQLPLLP